MMTRKIQESLWLQFGAAIDMLHNVIAGCTDDYLAAHRRFYYLAYHAVVLLDYYLSVPPVGFVPVLPFTIKNENERPPGAVGDMVPDEVYSRQQLLDYVAASRLKCKRLIDTLTDADQLNNRFTEGDQDGDMDYPVLEILLYNLRHTQHHVGQLHLMIRQDRDEHMPWAFRVEEE